MYSEDYSNNIYASARLLMGSLFPQKLSDWPWNPPSCVGYDVSNVGLLEIWKFTSRIFIEFPSDVIDTRESRSWRPKLTFPNQIPSRSLTASERLHVMDTTRRLLSYEKILPRRKSHKFRLGNKPAKMSLKLSFHFPEESFLAGMGRQGTQFSDHFIVQQIFINLGKVEFKWSHMETEVGQSSKCGDRICIHTHRTKCHCFPLRRELSQQRNLIFNCNPWQVKLLVFLSRGSWFRDLTNSQGITSRNNLIEIKFCKLNIRRAQCGIVSHIKSVPGWGKRMHKLLFE